WRLTAGVAGVLLVSAAVVFLVVYHGTGSQLEIDIDRDLSGDTSQMIQALHGLDGQPAARIRAAATDYVRTQSFTATSTILFVLMPGGATASNHPELFGSPYPQPGESEAEQLQENAEGRRLEVPRPGYSVMPVPDVRRRGICEQRAKMGTMQLIAGAGEPLSLVSRAQHGVARAFVLAIVVVLVLALLASYLAGARVSAPLRRMAGVATQVDAG